MTCLPSKAVCLISDEGYLVPTLSAALSARHNVEPDVDVVILCVGMCRETLHRLNRTFDGERLSFVDLPARWRGHYNSAKFRTGDGSYVNDLTLGRFFLTDHLKDYDKLLYIDGDILVSGSLTHLFGRELSKGAILASADSLTFTRHHSTRLGADTRNYFSSIGFNDDRIYFNAGVLLANSQTWMSLRDDAFEFFRSYPEKCHHHDQTAINVTRGDAIVPISISCNFQSNYSYWGVCCADATIRHFAGGIKPWVEKVWPFLSSSDQYCRYMKAIAAAGITTPYPNLNVRRSLRHMAKCVSLRTIQRSELAVTLAQIANYEEAVASIG